METPTKTTPSKDTANTLANSNGFVQRRLRVLKFLMVTSGVLRDPVIVYALLGSVSRTGLIFAINETASRLDQPPGWSIGLLVMSAVVLLVMTYLSRLRAHVMINRIQVSIRRRMTRLLLRADIDFLLSRDHGQVYSAMTHDVGEVSGAVVNIIEAVEAIVVIAIAVPYLFWISWSAGLATVLAMMVGTLGYVLLDLPARGWVVKGSHATAQFCNRVEDMLAGWKELRLRETRRDAVEQETLAVIEETAEYSMRAERLYSGSTVVGQSAMILLLCFVVALVPLLQGGGAETLFQVLTVVLLTSAPIESLFAALPRLSRAEASFAKINGVEAALENAQIGLPVDRGDQANAAGAAPTSFDKIELRGVAAQISEPGKPSNEAFHLGPIDLTFTPGETVFICGGNGAGKTTLLSLISGLRHPDAGQILLDGQPLDPQSLAKHRALFSGVFSGFHLFDRTFGLNAEEIATLEARITELQLGERVSVIADKFSSVSLSSGQRRRLALAVALAEARPVIILDEFAADQDPVNRAWFYDVLVPQLAQAGRLVIAVTHDDHQFGKCDRLIKMHAGRIESDVRVKVGKST